MVSGNYLMPAANTNPVAASAAPATKSAVSNRVSFQSLRMLHLNRWPTSQAKSFRLPFWRRSLGDKWAAQSLLRACPPEAWRSISAQGSFWRPRTWSILEPTFHAGLRRGPQLTRRLPCCKQARRPLIPSDATNFHFGLEGALRRAERLKAFGSIFLSRASSLAFSAVILRDSSATMASCSLHNSSRDISFS